MPEDYEDREEDGRPYQDDAALRAIAYLCRHVGGFRDMSAAEQDYFLRAFGLSDEDAKKARLLNRRLPAFNIHEPPKVHLHDEEQACEIGWPPGVLTPVFYGFEDLDEDDCAPGPLRVWYPSLDGSPSSAPVLSACGPYPLVMMLHGHCAEEDHYQNWNLLPAQLARSGYVVVAPKLPEIAGGWHPGEMPEPEPEQIATLMFGPCPPPLWLSEDSDLALAENIAAWMRNGWHYRSCLMPEPTTAVVGHSFGAALAGRIAARGKVPISAFISLSGDWGDWPTDFSPRPHDSLGVPAMFTWGTDDDHGALLAGTDGTLWKQVVPPKHMVTFEGGNHWDYLRDAETTCEGTRGRCNLVSALAADFVALFLSKYMPPEHWSSLDILIPNSLIPPSISLTTEQQFFAGGHLMGLTLVPTNSDCTATHDWEAAGGDTGAVVLSGS